MRWWRWGIRREVLYCSARVAFGAGTRGGEREDTHSDVPKLPRMVLSIAACINTVTQVHRGRTAVPRLPPLLQDLMLQDLPLRAKMLPPAPAVTSPETPLSTSVPSNASNHSRVPPRGWGVRRTAVSMHRSHQHLGLLSTRNTRIQATKKKRKCSYAAVSNA